MPASTPTPPPTSIYFENLNAIRFIAAFLVIVHHTEQLRSLLHVPNHWGNPVVLVIGKLGVVLFFVLSGFLISYLLFKEEDVTQTIDVRAFYMRRALRIWPLYFLIVFAALFVLPRLPAFTLADFPREMVEKHLMAKLVLFVLFLPNLVLNVFGVIPYASQTWSIGAEEQFYLVWPVLNKWVKNKLWLMIGVIAGYLTVKVGLSHVLPPGRVLFVLSGLVESTPIDCMAIGGLFAVVLHKPAGVASAIKQFLFRPAVQWVTLLAVTLLVGRGVTFEFLHYEIYAVLFGILICNFAANPNRIFSLETPWLNYLGEISYGLYMFHTLAIVASIRLLQQTHLLNEWLLYPLVLTVAVTLAGLSYRFLERPFIRIKKKYAKIISGKDAKNVDMPALALQKAN